MISGCKITFYLSNHQIFSMFFAVSRQITVCCMPMYLYHEERVCALSSCTCLLRLFYHNLHPHGIRAFTRTYYICARTEHAAQLIGTAEGLVRANGLARYIINRYFFSCHVLGIYMQNDTEQSLLKMLLVITGVKYRQCKKKYDILQYIIFCVAKGGFPACERRLFTL